MASEVRSPMEGKVFKIVKSLGDAVATNDAVIVLDAMKMEIEVVAPAAGVIAQISVSVGDSVESDTLLAIIDES